MNQLNLLSYLNSKSKPKSTKNATANNLIFVKEKEKTIIKRNENVQKSGNFSPYAEFKLNKPETLMNKVKKVTQNSEKSETKVKQEQFKKMRSLAYNRDQTRSETLENLSSTKILNSQSNSLFTSYNNKKLNNILQKTQSPSQQSNLKYILTNGLRKNPSHNRSPRNKEVSLSLLPKFSEKESNLKTETSMNTNKEGSVILTKSLEHMNSTSVHIAYTEPSADPRDLIIEKLNSRINDLEVKLKDLQEKVVENKPLDSIGNIMINSYKDQVMKSESKTSSGKPKNSLLIDPNISSHFQNLHSPQSNLIKYYEPLFTSPNLSEKKNRIISISKIETIRSKFHKPESFQNIGALPVSSCVNKNVGLSVNSSNLIKPKNKEANLSPNHYAKYHTKPPSFINSLQTSQEEESINNPRPVYKSVNASPRKCNRKNFLIREMNILDKSQERERKRDDSFYEEEKSDVSFILSNKFYKEQLDSIKDKTKNILNRLSWENSYLVSKINNDKVKGNINTGQHTHIHSKSYLL